MNTDSILPEGVYDSLVQVEEMPRPLLHIKSSKKPSVPIEIIIVKNVSAKINELAQLLEENKITIVYCEDGKSLARRFKTKFVDSQSAKKIRQITTGLDKAGYVIVSRVGDEEINLPDIDRIIEYTFLLGSPHQDPQCVDCLFHTMETGEHVILTTSKEFNNYQNQVHSLQEQGFKILVKDKTI